MNIKEANEMLKQRNKLTKSMQGEGKSTQAIDTLTRFVDVVTGEPSEEVQRLGAAEMWEQSKSKVIGYPQATSIFKAMIKQAEREAVAQNVLQRAEAE